MRLASSDLERTRMGLWQAAADEYDGARILGQLIDNDDARQIRMAIELIGLKDDLLNAVAAYLHALGRA